MMDLVYETWYCVFSDKHYISKPNFTHAVLFIVKNLMILAQNIQMFWYFDMPIQNWDKYKVFWNIISLPSIDLIAAEYQVISHFFLGVMIFIYSILAGLALILILLYFEKKSLRFSQWL